MADPKVTAAQEDQQGDVLGSLRSAFQRLAEESVRKAIQGQAPPARPAADLSAEIRKAVTDAVGAVLLETTILDRLITKHLEANPGTKGGEAKASDSLRAEVREIVHKELKSFITSNEFKELIDEKFRTITLYLKTEVIPKAAREAVARVEA